ncbi:carboxymuconolactone decarboxylase family protein [Neoroseomonas soli]|uniref:4-carboxymuconolactone decarboxylase n=1 Tax=Neoroseomonas soli TaxID=1081025 RepID=A0A9X9WTJ1_9PROT|nr:carboxymuconolactone decarboxylase family protein [Neoroseomonas soli]MBR0670470.1 4-carboxymuconolactone decarboxylase [Neoroseomonas soli]
MSDDLLEAGKQLRAEVIGQERHDAAMKNATPFDLPFQELALRYCWGEVWGRPGLSRKIRSMVNLGMLVALGKPNELKIHVRGALTNGVTKDEIQEIFLQTCIYCGVPAAGEAFRVAKEVFAEPEFADR